MKYTFDTDKIANYLIQFKDKLPELYTWNAKIEKLVDLGVINHSELINLKNKTSYDKEIVLKKKVNLKLHEYFKYNKILFDNLCLWIIKDWGGILTAKDTDTLELIKEFLESENPKYKRIASASKVGAYMFPEKYIIYDSRVAYALNWIILSENTGEIFFPIPSGRNSKMTAFEMNVLIRLKNIQHYAPKDISEMDKRLYIKQKDKTNYIPEKESYIELNNLIKEVSKKIWNEEKSKMLYYTEMLLFSIADREIFEDITNRLTLEIK
ncbi:hypothetical protein [Tenacibaculum finnmarkense]|uniref:hypothetical protein n=1 Tax=Tenacibaculum finnmarkense TaxID=2781243 RepID=UPI001E325BE6|nr:hypothetical protein [Tenacibaculum finnmarkense]MCD8403925.1 hypothetical protein [Tenacibaculum finnmarkense genomovar finnmarkense]